MLHYHDIVWLDHEQAIVMHISPDDVEKSVVHPAKPHLKLHTRSGTLGAGRQAEDLDYYHAIVEALKGAQEVLVVGPAQAKLQLIKYIHSHDHGMVNKIVGVETVDHPVTRNYSPMRASILLQKAACWLSPDQCLVSRGRRQISGEPWDRADPEAACSRLYTLRCLR